MIGIYWQGRPRCPCGALATQTARDVIREINWDTGMYQHRSGGLVSYGCEQHPPRSETIECSVLPHNLKRAQP